jgi:hypothetical protein
MTCTTSNQTCRKWHLHGSLRAQKKGFLEAHGPAAEPALLPTLPGNLKFRNLKFLIAAGTSLGMGICGIAALFNSDLILDHDLDHDLRHDLHLLPTFAEAVMMEERKDGTGNENNQNNFTDTKQLIQRNLERDQERNQQRNQQRIRNQQRNQQRNQHQQPNCRHFNFNPLQNQYDQPRGVDTVVHEAQVASWRNWQQSTGQNCKEGDETGDANGELVSSNIVSRQVSPSNTVPNESSNIVVHVPVDTRNDRSIRNNMVNHTNLNLVGALLTLDGALPLMRALLVNLMNLLVGNCGFLIRVGRFQVATVERWAVAFGLFVRAMFQDCLPQEYGMRIALMNALAAYLCEALSCLAWM